MKTRQLKDELGALLMAPALRLPQYQIAVKVLSFNFHSPPLLTLYELTSSFETNNLCD